MTFGTTTKKPTRTLRDELTSHYPELSPTKIQGLLDMAEQNGAKPDWKKQAVSEHTVADPFPTLTPVRLMRQLGVAKRAEEDPFEYRSNAGIEDCSSYRTELGAADAVWYCCSGHENTLVHFTGTYPFEYMKCYRCDHKICQRCHTTASGLVEALSGEHRGYQATDKDVRENQAVRWCMVCPRCALSYRASKRKLTLYPPTTCHCGHAFGSDWLQFLMGSVHQIWEYPHHVGLVAKHKWKMLQPVTYANRSHEKTRTDMGRRMAAKNMRRIIVYDPDKVSFP